MPQKNRPKKRVLSIVLALALFLSVFPVMPLFSSAAQDTRVADVSTMDDWKQFFGPDVLNTQNAGGVWGDKSVFTNADDFADYGISMTDPDRNFLVALSVIASNKSIVGYSAIPTDTVMVLDLSNSMSASSLSDMIEATNAAIRELQVLNRNNRVSVVVYAGSRVRQSGGPGGGGPGGGNSNTFGLSESAEVLLPLGRYEGVVSQGSTEENFLRYSQNQDTVSVINGVLGQGQSNPSMSASGATYIQAGLQLAWDEFNAVTDTVITEGPQKGTKRMPVLVLMSDGAPTVASTSFTNVGNSTHGTGSATNSTNAFLTQLSAVWVRTQMEEKYDRSGLLYTLGLDVENDDTARSVLNPAVSTNTLKTYWSNYLASSGNAYSTNNFSVAVNSDVKNFFKNDTDPVTYTFDTYIDGYYSASSSSSAGNQLVDAFDRIVDQIIVQSKYYPTLVESGDHNLDGYITFVDELGEYMEVKSIKGLTVAGSLYQGSALAAAVFDEDVFGDISSGDPANLTTAGREMLKAIVRRIGCSESDAVTLAIAAIENKQLYYNSDSDYSNYIGWYSDDDGNFMGYWDGGAVDTTLGASFVNKSYGFLGTVGSAEEYNQTDMLYVSVQVHKNIESGHEQILYRVPASLVPMVEYEIEFTGTELATGTDFKMSVSGAEEPLRLIYETGLRSDINPVNINDKISTTYKYKDSESGYRFFTNAWGEHSHSEISLPDSHDATTFDFEPSLKNERYYYVNNTPIYDASGNPVTSDPKQTSGTYYFKSVYFTTGSAAMSSAEMKTVMVPISAESLALATYDDLFDEWVIPKGTPYRIIADHSGTEYAKEKADKTLTGTLAYSNYPAIVHPTSDVDYHATACLGNNGTFTVKPEQGISLTKTMEYPELGQNETFTFEVTLTGENLPTSYPVYNYGGELLSTAALQSGNKLTVNLKPGQTVYVTGIPTGTKYAVAELLPAGSAWKVSKSSGTSGTVALYEFAAVSIENTPTTYGSLLINKTVKHPFGDSFAMPDKVFDITVTFTGVADGTQVTVDGAAKTINGGKLDLQISHGQTIVIDNLPDGTGYTVTEKDYAGFTFGGTGLTGTIDDTKNSEALLTNTYAPAAPELTFNHVGIKHLDGREWLEGDTFTFTLQYFNGIAWENVSSETRTVTKDSTDHSFTFDALLKNFNFSNIGVYHFRVLESFVDIGGVVCDTAEKRFTVTVADDAFSGKLKISDVTTSTPNSHNVKSGTVVTHNTTAGTWTVITHFNNVYSVRGTAAVIVNIQKQIVNNTGVVFGKSGFTFEVYEVRGNSEIFIGTTDPTDDIGFTDFVFNVDARRLGETITYKVVEVNDGKEGVHYDSSEKTFTLTLKDNLDGTVSAQINGQNTAEYAAQFTNTYALEEAPLSVSGTKNLTGRDLLDGEFVFELYRCADQNFSNPVRVDRQYNDGNTFILTDSLASAGTYYYILKEASSNLPHVTTDTAEYRLTVSVTKGTEATLKAEITSVTKGGAAVAVDGIVFNNEYTPDPTHLAIFGAKTMTGRNPADGEFYFLLLDAEGQPIGRVANNANGNFIFDEIAFTSAGTYVYTVKEDLSDKKSYITYDESVFTVTVVVSDDGNGNLSKTVSYKKGNEPVSGIVFNNAYVPTPITETFTGLKTMTGRNPKADEFTFLLLDATGATLDSASNAADGTFAFAAQTFSKAGTYRFIVSESTEGAKDYIHYDAYRVFITVTVTDNGQGVLSKSVSYEKGSAAATGITFHNVYNPDAVFVTLSGTKTLTFRNPKAEEFAFLLLNSEGKTVDTAYNTANGTFTFNTLELTEAGTYVYTVKEDLSDKKSYIGYDESVYTVTVTVTDDTAGNLSYSVSYAKGSAAASGLAFANEYRPTAETVVLEGSKIYNFGTLKGNEFKFLLLDASGSPVDSAVNDANGKFVFDELTFDTVGTFTYTVKEDLSDKKSYIVYDESVYTVTVTVTDDTVGALSATVSYSHGTAKAESIVFRNTYDPADAVVSLGGQKTLANRKLKAGEFTFLLINTDGKTVDSVSNAADGSFTFKEITFTKTGDYIFTVKEDATDKAEKVEYDDREYTVTVTVVDDNGTLKATVVGALGNTQADVKFENVYTPDPIKVVVAVKKILNNTTNQAMGLDGFEFKLTGDGVSSSVKSDAKGDASFPALEYTVADVGNRYTYVITEVPGTVEYMVYDKSEITVTVEITLTDEGVLVPVIKQNGVAVDAAVATFTNTYHQNPNTSDGGLQLWMLLALVGAGATSATLVLTRRREEQE